MADLVAAKEGGERSAEGRCHACGCVGPNPGYESMSDEEISKELATLRPFWVLSEDKKSISRKFTCKNWQAAMNVIGEISVHAESKEIQHHPDLHLTNYRDIEIVISTHAAGGLTKFDFILARALDGIKVDYSPKWLKQNPQAVAEGI